VDLATGTGFLAGLFAEKFKKVLALDISPSQISVA
jgi:ubiquinone/menaquinone biosynthesis C-methylase UbiE